MIEKFKITGGVYLVIDPVMERSRLLLKLGLALQGGLEAVQLWNNWLPGTNKLDLITAVSALCRAYGVPLLIDNDWELLLESPHLDGVHFDAVPDHYDDIKHKIERPFLTGITCSGNLDVVCWAQEHDLDYVSFCAMFPSTSAGSCNIVTPATVKKAHELTNLPLFVSGGITPENLLSLRKLTPLDGVAIISGIMSVEDPYSKVKSYQSALSRANNIL